MATPANSTVRARSRRPGRRSWPLRRSRAATIARGASILPRRSVATLRAAAAAIRGRRATSASARPTGCGAARHRTTRSPPCWRKTDHGGARMERRRLREIPPMGEEARARADSETARRVQMPLTSRLEAARSSRGFNSRPWLASSRCTALTCASSRLVSSDRHRTGSRLSGRSNDPSARLTRDVSVVEHDTAAPAAISLSISGSRSASAPPARSRFSRA